MWYSEEDSDDRLPSIHFQNVHRLHKTHLINWNEMYEETEVTSNIEELKHYVKTHFNKNYEKKLYSYKYERT